MQMSHRMTKHAHERSTSRAIPWGAIQTICDYGKSWDAGDGFRRYALNSQSMTMLRHSFGPHVFKAFDHYRRRGAYVVANDEKVITAAFAKKPFV